MMCSTGATGRNMYKASLGCRRRVRGWSSGGQFVMSCWDRLLYSYSAALDDAIGDELCDEGWARAECQRTARLKHLGPRAACASFRSTVDTFGGEMATIHVIGGGRAGAKAALNIACMADAVKGGRLDPTSPMFLYCQSAEIFRIQTVLAYMGHCPGLRPCLGGEWFRDASSFLVTWFPTLPAEWQHVASFRLTAEASLAILPFDTIGKRMLERPRFKPMLVAPDGRRLA